MGSALSPKPWQKLKVQLWEGSELIHGTYSKVSSLSIGGGGLAQFTPPTSIIKWEFLVHIVLTGNGAWRHRYSVVRLNNNAAISGKKSDLTDLDVFSISKCRVDYLNNGGSIAS